MAADSGSAILDGNFRPLKIVAISSIVADVPYRSASTQVSDILMVDANCHDLIVKELRMCRRLLQTVSADVVHLDMTLGGTSISQLTASDLHDMPISSRARQNIGRNLPELRKLATDIEQRFKAEVLAVGKESLPVRIAELTTGACSVVHAATEALNRKGTVFLGLPMLSKIMLSGRYVTARSLQHGEGDVAGFAEDNEELVRKVRISEFNNPIARGFRVLRIETREA